MSEDDLDKILLRTIINKLNTMLHDKKYSKDKELIRKDIKFYTKMLKDY